jgi:predicted DNA-binding protein
MKKIISVSLDEEQVKKIEDVCRISERTKSWLVKKAVDNYLEDLNDMETALERSLTEDKDLLTEKQLRRNLKN